MRNATIVQRALRSVLCLGAALLLVSVNLPHRHDGTAPHPERSCTACRVQGSLAATPPAPATLHHPTIPVASQRLPSHQAPRATLLVRSSVPRAPPFPSSL